MMFKLLITLLVFILVGCGSSEAEPEIFLKLKVGETLFKIPDKYVLPSLPASISGKGGSLDDSEGVSLKIPLQDIGYRVPNKKGLIGSVIVFITPASKNLKKISGDAFDAWRGENLYDERVVEYDEAVNLYRVYSKAGHPKIWHYFRNKPNGKYLDESGWVATCSVSPLNQEAADLSNVTCKTTMLYKDAQVEISYSGFHLPSLKDMISKLKNKMSHWETASST